MASPEAYSGSRGGEDGRKGDTPASLWLGAASGLQNYSDTFSQTGMHYDLAI